MNETEKMVGESGQPVTIKSMLEAGAHYGHQTQRWNPKMLPYIFGERNGIHIINLDLTIKLWERARKFVFDQVSQGGTVLFVGTKDQAASVIETEAKRCGAFFVTRRWLGGTLSNFQTIKRSFEKMRRHEDLLLKSEDPNSGVVLNKREKLDIRRQLDKFNAGLGGIREMRELPSLVFVVDVVKEAIAVSEAHRAHIPVVALVDTNVNPDDIAFPIPSNDDASRALKLFLGAMADTILEAKTVQKSRQNSDAMSGSGQEGGSVSVKSSRKNRQANQEQQVANAPTQA